MFKYDPGVISEVFGVIACLSNLTEFVETIGINGVHRQASLQWFYIIIEMILMLQSDLYMYTCLYTIDNIYRLRVYKCIIYTCV